MLTDKEQEEIRRKLWELEEEPPAFGWKKVDAELRPKRRWRGWLWLLPALLLIGIGTVLLWMPEKELSSGIRQKENGLANAPTEVAGTPTAATGKGKHGKTAAVPSGNKALAPLASQNSPAPDGTSLPYGGGMDTGTDTGSSLGMRAPRLSGESPSHTQRDTHASLYFREKKPTARQQPQEDGAEPLSARQNPAATLPSYGVFDTDETNLSGITGTTAYPFLRSRGIRLLYIPARHPHLSFPADTQVVAETVIEPVKQRQAARREWTLGLFFTPRYAFRKFMPVVSDEILITRLNNKNQSNTERVGYELGIQVSRAVRQNLYLESSLALVQLRENVSYSYATNKIDTLIRTVSGNNQLQVIPVYGTGQRQLVSSYAYGNWRLGASYYFWQNAYRRFNVTVSGGINILVKGRTRQYTDGMLEETVVFPSRDNILEQKNYNLSLGVGYTVSGGRPYELMIMPSFNYFLGSTFQAREPFGLRPYSIGVQLQLKRRFVRQTDRS
jgi:hypothetical protein